MSSPFLSNSPRLRKLLAVDRIELLFQAFSAESKDDLPPVRWFIVALSLCIGCIPMIVAFPSVLEQLGQNAFIFSGLALCLAIVLRNSARLPFRSVSSWKESLSLTHTAFGLGCIPAVLILCLLPDSAPRLTDMAPAESAAGSPSELPLAAFVLQVSIWAAVSEEFVYRALVLACLRRSPAPFSQRKKDVIAIFISAAMFGIAHLPLWGVALSIGATGLGLGFGLAYVASGERLIPLIVYHAIFDILSITATILLLR